MRHHELRVGGLKQEVYSATVLGVRLPSPLPPMAATASPLGSRFRADSLLSLPLLARGLDLCVSVTLCPNLSLPTDAGHIRGGVCPRSG